MDTIARLKLKGKQFEILVDCDKALALRKQKNTNPAAMRDVLSYDAVFVDNKKGLKHTDKDLMEAFGTSDINAVASRIIMEGEIQMSQEHRDKDREAKMKQIVDFLARNCVDPRTHAPYTADRISAALKQVGVRIDETRGVDEQALNIIKDLIKIMPIKIETKKIRLIVPAQYTGRIYGMLASFKKEKEEWLPDGSLECIITLPAGMQLEFYDKLNAITHGDSTTEEIKE
jgi:ribosome maturation protein SDO1